MEAKPENRAAKSPQSGEGNVKGEDDTTATDAQKDAERVPTTVVRDGK